MKTFGYAVLGMMGLGLLAVIVLVFMWVGYNNRDAELRNRAAASQKANEASFDAMWKILQQQAGVADEYKNGFKEIFADLIKGRYSGADGKGLLVKFITESNPTFDVLLYAKLMRSIEAERKRFLTDQQKLLDIKREHDDLRTRVPGKFFLSNASPLEVVIVTSEKADDAFRTGQDNDTNLFPKKGKQ